MTHQQQDERESWSEYRRLVMAGLRDLKADIDSVDRKLDKIKEDVLMLKIKAGIFGTVGGAAVSLIVSWIWKLLVNGGK